MSNNSDKRVATVDAVSGAIIHATMSIDARGTPAKGNYVILQSDGDLFLCRITSIDLKNPVHENDTFAPYIMMYGAVPEWSKEVDIERAQVEVIGMIDLATGKRIPWRRNPSSGTAIVTAKQGNLLAFSNEREHVLSLGYIPNSDGLLHTIVNRHHGKFEEGGYGEARHTGVFGQNGSGKTVLVMMLITGKLAAYHEMGLLMPDTAGDISDPSRHSRGDFHWNYAEVLEKAGIELEIIDIGDIRLTALGTLKELLTPFFNIHMSMALDKASILADRVVEGIFDKEVDVSRLTSDAVLKEMADNIGFIYAKNSRKEKEEDVENLASALGRRRPFEGGLERICKFFDGRENLGHLVNDVLKHGRKVIIRMGDGQLTEKEQAYVMREVMQELSWRARNIYTGTKDQPGRMCNALIGLDEAHRWVPQNSNDDDDAAAIAKIISRAFRETRKYGLGWTVISQRMSGISKEVLTQCHTKWFGRGVGVGNDRKHLEDHVGKNGLETYDQLEVQGGYFWVAVGMDNNIGTEGTYFTLAPFSGNATDAFIEANPQIFEKEKFPS